MVLIYYSTGSREILGCIPNITPARAIIYTYDIPAANLYVDVHLKLWLWQVCLVLFYEVHTTSTA